LPVTSLPPGVSPFPQSGCHGSVDCCAPYLATPKPHATARDFGVQPIVGTVMRVAVPVRRTCSTKRSAADPSGSELGFGLSEGMFSKYQSAAWLPVSFCQL